MTYTSDILEGLKSPTPNLGTPFLQRTCLMEILGAKKSAAKLKYSTLVWKYYSCSRFIVVFVDRFLSHPISASDIKSLNSGYFELEFYQSPMSFGHILA